LETGMLYAGRGEQTETPASAQSDPAPGQSGFFLFITFKAGLRPAMKPWHFADHRFRDSFLLIARSQTAPG
jgi:hypothetical protein